MLFCEENPSATVTLEQCQLVFNKSGVVRLIINTLMAKPDFGICKEALSLGISMLKPSNLTVQRSFCNAFLDTDDSGLWVVFSSIYDAVLANLKAVRSLKEVKRKHKRDREKAGRTWAAGSSPQSLLNLCHDS